MLRTTAIGNELKISLRTALLSKMELGKGLLLISRILQE
jgi:hypothetical protein